MPVVAGPKGEDRWQLWELGLFLFTFDLKVGFFSGVKKKKVGGKSGHSFSCVIVISCCIVSQ